MKPDVDSEKNRLMKIVEDSDTWQRIKQSRQIPSDIFKEAAIGGSNYVDPMLVFTKNDVEEIRAVLKET
jgi:hypothetical protein